MEFDSCNIIGLPIILYLLKDSIDVSGMSENFSLNACILISSMLISKKNFQASVYLMFTFVLLQILGKNLSSVNVSENFEEPSPHRVNVRDKKDIHTMKLVDTPPEDLHILDETRVDHVDTDKKDEENEFVMGFSSQDDYNYSCF
jgi:hypothetical protein